MAQLETKTRTTLKPNLSVKEPSKYKIIYLNDDVTSMEFVVESLVDHFEYDYTNAVNITEAIHEHGSAVVAVLPYEIAEQKGTEVIDKARSNNYPLQVKLESEAT